MPICLYVICIAFSVWPVGEDDIVGFLFAQAPFLWAAEFQVCGPKHDADQTHGNAQRHSQQLTTTLQWQSLQRS